MLLNPSPTLKVAYIRVNSFLKLGPSFLQLSWQVTRSKLWDKMHKYFQVLLICPNMPSRIYTFKPKPNIEGGLYKSTLIP